MRCFPVLACLAALASLGATSLDGRSSGYPLPTGDQVVYYETSDGPVTYEHLLRSVVHDGQVSPPLTFDYSPIGHFAGAPSAVQIGGHPFLYFLISVDRNSPSTVYRSPIRDDGGLGLLERLDPLTGLTNHEPRFCAYSGGVAVSFQSSSRPCVAVSPDGLHFGPPNEVDPGGGDGVAVGALGHGLVCAYHSSLAGAVTVFARTSEDAANWSRPIQISERAVRDPALLRRPDGNADLYYVAPTAIYRRSLNPAGELGREEHLVDQAVTRPSPSRLADGRVLLTFVNAQHQLSSLIFTTDAQAPGGPATAAATPALRQDRRPAGNAGTIGWRAPAPPEPGSR